MNLKVGYRFHPTDEELINYFLKNKVIGNDSAVKDDIAEVDICKWEPWELPKCAANKSDDEEWYFFCPPDYKYTNSRRSNRTTKAGRWIPTGKDRIIWSKKGTKKEIGIKKTIVFYKHHVPNGLGTNLSKNKKGIRTNWVIHEYRPSPIDPGSDFLNQSAYVNCRLKKNTDEKANDSIPDEGESSCHVPFGYRNISENTADEGESSRQVPFPYGNIPENTSLEVRRNSNPDEGESSHQMPFGYRNISENTADEGELSCQVLFAYGNIPENISPEDNPQLLPNLKSLMNNGWLNCDSPFALQSHMVVEPGQINQWPSNSSVDSSTNMPYQIICNQLASEETPTHKSQHQLVDQNVDDMVSAESMNVNYDNYFEWDDDTNQNLDNMMDY